MDDKYDEYRVVEQNNSSVYGAGSASAKGPANKRKGIIIAIGVLIVVVVLFRLIGGLMQKKPVETAAVKPSKPVAIQAPVRVAAQPVPANDNRITNLENQVSNLQNTISQISDQLNSVNSNIQGLAEQIVKNHERLQSLEMAKKKPKVVKPVPMIGAQQTYYIQAMIPGRAWLIDANGNTLTIHSGDQLPGYGVIQTVDPGQGNIMTSSGRVLEYHPLDS